MTNRLDEEYRLVLEYNSIPHNCGTGTMYQTESQIIHIVGKNPGITAAETAAPLTKTPSAYSQLIRKLGKKDWTEQVHNPENSREYQLFSTGSGWEICEKRDRLEQACYKRGFNSLKEFSEEDLEKYISI